MTRMLLVLVGAAVALQWACIYFAGMSDPDNPALVIKAIASALGCGALVLAWKIARLDGKS